MKSWLRRYIYIYIGAEKGVQSMQHPFADTSPSALSPRLFSNFCQRQPDVESQISNMFDIYLIQDQGGSSPIGRGRIILLTAHTLRSAWTNSRLRPSRGSGEDIHEQQALGLQIIFVDFIRNISFVTEALEKIHKRKTFHWKNGSGMEELAVSSDIPSGL